MQAGTEVTYKRKVAYVGIVCLLSIAMAAALGEILVRVVAPRSDPIKLGVKLDNSSRLYGLRPNHTSLQTGVTVRTNALGFRENEYLVERRPGVKRLVVLGDSYTFGVGVDFPETYSKRLEAYLNTSGSPHEVINFGVHGYNSSLELATLRESAAKFKPDLIIVGYVLNDTERLAAEPTHAPKPARSGLNAAHVWLKDTFMLYRFLAPKLGSLAGLFNLRYAVGGTNEIINSYADDSPGWMESRQALVDIAAEGRKIGARTLVVVFPMMVDFQTYPLGLAHDRVVRFCRENGIEVLDLMSSLRGQKVSEMMVPLDGHPNGKAHKIFAEHIFRHLSARPGGNLL